MRLGVSQGPGRPHGAPWGAGDPVSADTLRIVVGLALVALASWWPFVALARLGGLRGEARRRALAEGSP